MEKKTDYTAELDALKVAMDHLDEMLEEGDMDEAEFKSAVNHYMKAVILRARIQSTVTIRSAK